MLMGLYLNIDNKALDNCQNLADDKMTELCGSTTDCNSFASDAVLGTGSLKSQKDNTVYRVTGMISFGSIKMGDATGGVTDGGEVLKPGEIGVKDYIAEIKKKNKSIENADAIISSIEEELNNIAGTINRAISLIESDQKIQYCITGRDLSQINGKVDKKGKGDQTAGRFPNLLNQYRVMIGMAALRQAQNNYNKALTEKIEQATKDASADVAEFMCHKIGDMGNTEYDLNKLSQQTPLTTPFSISYDVGSGLTTEALMSGGRGSISKDGGTSEYRGRTTQNSGVFISREATFNRDSRICHVCTTTTTKSCENVTKYFKSESKCSTSTGEPVCEDLKL